MTARDDYEERAVDAAITVLCRRLTGITMPDTGESAYRAVMGYMSPDERVEVERAMDRHGERRRAAGEPGW